MISFTPTAAKKVQEFLASAGKEGMALRLAIMERTPQGFVYRFTLEEYDQERTTDMVLRESGFATRIDPDSAKWLKGATVDWVLQDGQPGFAVANPNKPAAPETPEALKAAIFDALKTIYDPEIPVNIYDLGLIYDVILDDDKRAKIMMTLTTPNCPAAESLPAEVETKVKSVPGVTEATIELTWEPPWDQSMMSEAAKLQLNL